jgi:hypothetical protein
MEWGLNNGARRIQFFFLNPAELYFNMKNTAVLKGPNS